MKCWALYGSIGVCGVLRNPQVDPFLQRFFSHQLLLVNSLPFAQVGIKSVLLKKC